MVDINLESHCEMCEHLRYKYGADIFLVLYVRLLTLATISDTQKANSLYEKILKALGITRQDILFMKKQTYKDGVMAEFAKAITVTGLQKSIGILEGFVYSVKSIRQTIEAYGV